jgi:hypothetical protein
MPQLAIREEFPVSKLIFPDHSYTPVLSSHAQVGRKGKNKQKWAENKKWAVSFPSQISGSGDE